MQINWAKTGSILVLGGLVLRPRVTSRQVEGEILTRVLRGAPHPCDRLTALDVPVPVGAVTLVDRTPRPGTGDTCGITTIINNGLWYANFNAYSRRLMTAMLMILKRRYFRWVIYIFSLEIRTREMKVQENVFKLSFSFDTTSDAPEKILDLSSSLGPVDKTFFFICLVCRSVKLLHLICMEMEYVIITSRLS